MSLGKGAVLALLLASRAALAQDAADAGEPVDAGEAVGAGEATPSPADVVDAGSVSVTVPVATAAALVDAGVSEATALEGEAFFQEMLSVESQLQEMVVSSTRTATRASQVPAVVTVVTADEIQSRALVDLAGVLRTVPGFYDVHDLVTHNIGVRGVSGGLRASGNVIKLMIDGVAVDYRPTTGNFFGPELIPIEIVERVEIIRGPASALYGANAFLGVVNVITKKGTSLSPQVSVRGVVVRDKPGVQGTAVVAAHVGDLDVLVAGHLGYLDRSGLALPKDSPNLTRTVWPPTPFPFAERGNSQGDLSRPSSVFAKVGLTDKLGGRLTLLSSWQHLDSVAEFGDVGTLFHGSRVQLENRNYQLMYELPKWERVGVTVAVQHFTASPGPDAVHHIGLSDTLLLPRNGVTGWGGSAEGQFQLHDRFRLVVGVDAVREDHLQPTYDRLQTQDSVGASGNVIRQKGDLIPGVEAGTRRLFFNVGALVQAQLSLGEAWTLTAGGRGDFHNIYGINPTGRAAIVFAPPQQPFSAKLLYGSSYKAPSATQLFTHPMGGGDLKGNVSLKSQHAHTVELAGGYQLPGDWGDITINGFVTSVLGRVEFLRLGNFAVAHNNTDEWVAGGELDARLRPHPRLQLRLAVGYAGTVARSPPIIITGAPELSFPLFPPIQAHLIGTFLLPFANLRLSAEVSLIGARSASQSNALTAGKDYQYEPYVQTAAVLALPPTKLWGDRDTSASFRVENLLGWQYADPGFNGVDVPAQGRTFFLQVSQSF